MANMSTTGSVDPTQFIGADGKFDLIAMCTVATLSGWRVLLLFVGDGDGSLAYRCGIQCSALHCVFVCHKVMEHRGRHACSYLEHRTYPCELSRAFTW